MMADSRRDTGKEAGAMLAIGEVAERVGVPTHILRYWETRFPELKPLQRSGRRRYYRAEDVALVERIYDLLHRKGFTVEGARKAMIEGETAGHHSPHQGAKEPLSVGSLIALRQRLARALED